MSESNVNFDFQIENNKVRAENDKIKDNLNAEISNEENKGDRKRPCTRLIWPLRRHLDSF